MRIEGALSARARSSASAAIFPTFTPDAGTTSNCVTTGPVVRPTILPSTLNVPRVSTSVSPSRSSASLLTEYSCPLGADKRSSGGSSPPIGWEVAASSFDAAGGLRFGSGAMGRAAIVRGGAALSPFFACAIASRSAPASSPGLGRRRNRSASFPTATRRFPVSALICARAAAATCGSLPPPLRRPATLLKLAVVARETTRNGPGPRMRRVAPT